MAADRAGIETGSQFLARCPVAPLCSPIAPALGLWLVDAARLVTLYLPPAVTMYGMVPHTASIVYSVALCRSPIA